MKQSATQQVQDLMKFRLAEIHDAAEQIQTCPACGGSGGSGTWDINANKLTAVKQCQTCNGQGLTIKN